MLNLAFPKYEFRLKEVNQKKFIFDEIRKKYIQLTAEDWVRQNCIKFLISKKKYNKDLISVEKKINLSNSISKRFDIVIYNKNSECELLVECKAPNIEINQKTFDQIFKYDTMLNAKFLMLTNGIIHYYCKVDKLNNKVFFLKNLP